MRSMEFRLIDGDQIEHAEASRTYRECITVISRLWHTRSLQSSRHDYSARCISHGILDYRLLLVWVCFHFLLVLLPLVACWIFALCFAGAPRGRFWCQPRKV